MATRADKQPKKKPTADGILESAARVFAEHGYGGTSLRDLMAAAGVSTTAFYARFPSKEAVLAALVGRLLETLAARAAEALPAAKSVEEGFTIGVDVLVDTLAPEKAIVGLALTEATISDDARATLRSAYGALAGLLAARLSSMDGVAKKDATAIAWSLVGALKMQVERWAVLDDLDDKELRRACRATANVLLPLVRPRRR